jgi:hypothetical protein
MPLPTFVDRASQLNHHQNGDNRQHDQRHDSEVDGITGYVSQQSETSIFRHQGHAALGAFTRR